LTSPPELPRLARFFQLILAGLHFSWPAFDDLINSQAPVAG
jgi:hypothetical protein